MPEKKKRKQTKLGRFLTKVTGAQKIIEGFEGKPKMKAGPGKTPRDTADMTRLRFEAGTSVKAKNGKLTRVFRRKKKK